MIELLVAKLGWSVGYAVLKAFVKKYWKPLLFGAIGLAVLSTMAVQHWRINSLTAARAKDQLAISDAVAANKSNIDTIRHMNRAAEIDRQTAAAAATRDTKRRAGTEKDIQEIQNDPRAFDPAGPVFDDLGDRLRAHDQDRDADPHRIP